MSTVATLEVINASLAVLKLLSSLKVDAAELIALQQKAEFENREITEEELKQLSDQAQQAIDEL